MVSVSVSIAIIDLLMRRRLKRSLPSALAVHGTSRSELDRPNIQLNLCFLLFTTTIAGVQITNIYSRSPDPGLDRILDHGTQLQSGQIVLLNGRVMVWTRPTGSEPIIS